MEGGLVMIHLTKYTLRKDLDRIKKGDTVCDDNGKSGEVEAIQVLKHNTQKEYYYKLKNDGVIYLIK